MIAMLFLLAQEVKIGYIDSGRILQEYKGIAELQRQYEKEVREWQRKAEEMRREIEQMQRELEAQSIMLSEEARLRRMKEIEEKQREYEQFLQEIWGPEGLAKKRNEEIMRPLIEKIQNILQTIGENEGFTVILDIASGAVVYAKEGLDLTDRVLEELNREYAGAEEVEEVEFWVVEFKNENSEAIAENLGERIANLIISALKNAGFKQGKTNDYLTAKAQAGVSTEDELYEDENKAVEMVGAFSEIRVLVTGGVKKEGEKITVTYRVYDKKEGKKVKEETITVEGEELKTLQALTNEIAGKIAVLFK